MHLPQIMQMPLFLISSLDNSNWEKRFKVYIGFRTSESIKYISDKKSIQIQTTVKRTLMPWVKLCEFYMNQIPTSEN